MHLSLSDLLTCPRCGPDYGLILIPARTRERRVEAGVLGCPNCRERYAIDQGVAELWVAGATASASATAAPAGRAAATGGADRKITVAGLPPDDPELAVRLGALLGLAGAGGGGAGASGAAGAVVLAGPAAAQAARVARLLEDVEVVALGPTFTAAERAMAVTRVRVEGAIPFRGGVFGAVALTGPWSERVPEGLRVLRPGGRLLVDPATAEARAHLAGAGTVGVLDQGSTLVVARKR
jgi:uncharacterized protein YbaR (Trm112 family)